MTADSEADLRALRAIGRICAATLRRMMAVVRPGLPTAESDEFGRRLLEAAALRSAPLITYHYPGDTCISVSPVIAHGIPGRQVLQANDLIHIDGSAELDGCFADTAASLPVWKSSPDIHRLLEAAKATLWKALRVAKAGKRLNEIGRTVEREAGRCGYHVIRGLTGHGIGRRRHEAPDEVWNFHNPRDGRILNEGLVPAVEPFLITGQGRIREESDGWSLRMADHAIAAQFEHTRVVTRNEPRVLTL